MMTPSEQIAWMTAYGTVYGRNVAAMGTAHDAGSREIRACLAVKCADEAVLALREYGTKHGPGIGAVVAGEEVVDG